MVLQMKKSHFVSLVAVFASFNVVCDSLMGLPWVSSGVWYSWIFIAEPITGIVLGPYAGFLSSLIGVMIGHFIYFRGPYEFLFTLGAPIGAMISGFLFRRRWKTVLTYYTVLFAIYFITPVAWQLPVWGMWNVYLAYASLLVVTVIMVKKKSWNLDSKGLLHAMVMCAFIGLEADVLFRIVVFIPGQTYKLFYDYSVETLRLVWMEGAAETPIKVALSTLVTAIVGPPVIRAVKKMKLFSD
jgi:hypothetical protein